MGLCESLLGSFVTAPRMCSRRWNSHGCIRPTGGAFCWGPPTVLTCGRNWTPTRPCPRRSWRGEPTAPLRRHGMFGRIGMSWRGRRPGRGSVLALRYEVPLQPQGKLSTGIPENLPPLHLAALGRVLKNRFSCTLGRSHVNTCSHLAGGDQGPKSCPSG